MAGHSHFANIMRRKSRVDAKRGKVFSKIARKIIQAARSGGGKPEANLSLHYAIVEAKAANMPKDTIEKAIAKGTGELGGANFEELIYGGYGPGGAAILCEALTDNRNRTAPEIKKIFERRGGKFDDSGSTIYKFEQRGLIAVALDAIDEDRLMDVVLEAGADDLEADTTLGIYTITTAVEAFHAVRQALEAAEIAVESADLSRVPQVELELPDADGQKIARLMDELDDNDDVQRVYTDARLSPGLLES